MGKIKVGKSVFIQAVRDNPGKSIKQVAVSLGLAPNYGYKLQWKYRAEIRDMAVQFTKAIAFEQVKQLQRNGSKRYDTRASQILLEMAQAYTPGGDKTKQQVINVGVVVLPVRSQAGQPLEMGTSCSIQIDDDKQVNNIITSNTSANEAILGSTAQEGDDV